MTGELLPLFNGSLWSSVTLDHGVGILVVYTGFTGIAAELSLHD